MYKPFKIALVASLLGAAAGAYASTEDGGPDNAWIGRAVASIHMEPQVVIMDTTPYSVSFNAPAPAAAGAGDPVAESTTRGAVMDQRPMAQQPLLATPTFATPTSPLIDTTQAVQP